jgi:hypothetical protein
MIAPGDFLALMTALLGRSLDAQAFVERFIALRNELVREQNLAISHNPQVSDRLDELGRLHGAGAMSSDEYLRAVEAQYAQLEELPLPPGSPADAIVQQLFVELDAYGQSPGIGPLFDEQDLRDAVAVALHELQPD